MRRRVLARRQPAAGDLRHSKALHRVDPTPEPHRLLHPGRTRTRALCRIRGLPRVAARAVLVPAVVPAVAPHLTLSLAFLRAWAGQGVQERAQALARVLALAQVQVLALAQEQGLALALAPRWEGQVPRGQTLLPRFSVVPARALVG